MGIGIALVVQGQREHRQQRRDERRREGAAASSPISLKYGADTVMDLSTGGDIDGIRDAIIGASPVPIGTVPIYQALSGREGASRSSPRDDMIDMLEHQAQQGVDYFTIHAGVLVEHLPLVKDRITGHRLARRLDHGAVDDRAPQAEPVLHALGQGPRDLREVRRHDLAGDGLRPGCLADASDEAQFAELDDARRAHEARVGEGRAGDDRRARATCRSIRSR